MAVEDGERFSLVHEVVTRKISGPSGLGGGGLLGGQGRGGDADKFTAQAVNLSAPSPARLFPACPRADGPENFQVAEALDHERLHLEFRLQYERLVWEGVVIPWWPMVHG